MTHELIDLVADALAHVAITSRRMMGGWTLYADGTVFAIVADDRLWFKADAASDAEWDAAGAERFAMTMKDGRVASMNYRLAPDDCYDDPDALRRWATLALTAGGRAAAARKPRRPRAAAARTRRS